MFLYQFVRCRCHRRLQILVYAITFEQFLDFFHFWHDCLPWPIDYLNRFWWIFVVTFTSNFQGQIWNLLYLNQRWCDCHGTKSKHIDWSQGLKWDHQVSPWPWPWPWMFKVKYGICYISAKNRPDCHETKSKHIDWILCLKCEHQFDLDHDLHLAFSRSNIEFSISQPKVVWLPRNKKQTYQLNSRPQMWPMGLTLAMTLTFEFSRLNVILTIWWPRSGIRIYQIVSGVTSDVGVPSTHLVSYLGWSLMTDGVWKSLNTVASIIINMLYACIIFRNYLLS